MSARAIKIVYKMLSGKPGENRWLGRHIWVEGGTRVDLKGTGWEGADCIYVTQERDQWRAVVNTVMNLPAPHKENFLTRWAIISLSIILLHGVVLMIFIDVVLIMTIKNRVDQLVEW